MSDATRPEDNDDEEGSEEKPPLAQKLCKFFDQSNTALNLLMALFIGTPCSTNARLLKNSPVTGEFKSKKNYEKGFIASITSFRAQYDYPKFSHSGEMSIGC
ncbi:hypothetical protein AVEN_160233-1 [Araneus ventricosus]|uniref:Uncharacterized protein n=1 Tax=Araneus ventricosus TaxID=182803 RepID=A0A4Y2HCD4_ARAVE|nr:hypothetical protein AVEN_160233-1 [Araneus ventricosus]